MNSLRRLVGGQARSGIWVRVVVMMLIQPAVPCITAENAHPEPPAAAATFTVTQTGNSGPGSLRQAIELANLFPGADVINFNIPGAGVRVIRLSSALPVITGPVFIDGTSQPGYSGVPLIELDGTNAAASAGTIEGVQQGQGANGLVITAGNSTV
ncbi:MAG: hypothetical protein HY650_02790, partial [Acidobacteria bacterium]|nr:hypothetical protein [Acidobacteriota bacterium]